MTRERSKIKVERPRCPYCHDDIVPGEKNRACYSCLAWHHTECWDSNGNKCVGCGDSLDNWEIRSIDLVADPPVKESYISFDGSKFAQEHADIRRAEEGPQKEPPCNHQFDPHDNKCVYCHSDAMEVYQSQRTQDLLNSLARQDRWVENALRRADQRFKARQKLEKEEKERKEKFKEEMRNTPGVTELRPGVYKYSSEEKEKKETKKVASTVDFVLLFIVGGLLIAFLAGGIPRQVFLAIVMAYCAKEVSRAYVQQSQLEEKADG